MNPRIATRPSPIALGCALWGSLALGCASWPAAATSSTCLLTTKPALRTQSVAWHAIDVSVLSQVAQGLDVARLARRALGHPTPSINLHDGSVPDGSFLTDRDLAALAPEAVRRGPTQPWQEAQPPFLITRLKGEGKTAGFVVTDATGDRYLFKLDVPEYPELITGAEVVTSKLLWALGYFVPSYEIVDAAVDDFTIGEGLGSAQESARRLLTEHAHNGRVRASASRWLDGEILGPFRFKRHRACAELRALKLAYAWVNNTDAKDHNTLLVWTGTHAIGFLIDFGSSLGADAARGPKRPCQGWAYDVDLAQWTFELLTLGLSANGCDPRERIVSPAVGRFSARLDPRRWKPYIPNLAFEEMTEADARWMAARLAKVSQAHVEAAVAAGRYQHEADAAQILEVLDARRQAILNAYLTK